MKFFSSGVSQISIGGVLLKAEKIIGGFVLDVEDGFKHVDVLISHGFVVLEEKAAALVRRPVPPVPPATPIVPSNPASSGKKAGTDPDSNEDLTTQQ